MKKRPIYEPEQNKDLRERFNWVFEQYNVETVFVTSDGKAFFSEDKAREHAVTDNLNVEQLKR